ncbi:helicase C-terminal domain-containing protein [Streptomyces sp. 549]|uniref:helicase C-terminal domain-containing protein n=1 Tax=Streptomyces sp. 549 TaxID=3049076 RepID=UPI0024C21FBE|nr:helicase C-terminal domain-containing protein [Streptomyces sp. 549]MDK1472508.1 helicase C-terminal domain-containing protein [Streptomyces sp. 549]
MTSETGSPRTLADELRALPDEALAALLRARPDLLSPVPGDLTQLATRAGTRASVVRAVERLDTFALQTAQALAVAPDPCDLPALAALLPGGEEQLPTAVAALRAQALVWGGERLRLVRTARELLSPSATTTSPTGLGPSLAEAAAGTSPGRLQELVAACGLPATHDPVSAVNALTDLFTDRTRMAELLAGAPPEAAAMLGKLVWGPPYGTVATADPADGTAPVAGVFSAPVRWLLDRGLLLPAGPRAAPGPGGGRGHTVLLPREVALHLREGRAHRELEPVPPPVAAQRVHPLPTVDGTAAGQAFTAVSTVEELLKEWERAAPAVLRAGGLGVRDLRRTAAALDLPEPETAFWVELAHAAGLVASDGETDERYAPTPAYDDWLDRAPQDRWAVLVAAWLPGTRVPGLAGTRDGKGRTLSALGPGLDRSLAPALRRRTLELLAELPECGTPEPGALLERLRWERPLRSGDELRATMGTAVLTEAEQLGLTGRGALAGHARPLLDAAFAPGGTASGGTASGDGPAATAGPAAKAAALLAPLLPEPLDHVLLQADLTAVAPGPLRRPLSDALSVLAEVESKGAATVYRFTPQSVRRALDAGRSATELHAFLAAHSRTPVPQPLTYLVDDVARRHGRLRVGAASSYVRCDDDALLTEILADRRSAGLRLRLLAPTVLASAAAPDQLLAGLRDLGFAPAAESADGDVLIARPDAHRTPPRTPPEPVPDGPPRPDDTLLAAAVRAIRAGDLAAVTPHKPRAPRHTPEGTLPRTTSADTLATMQSAVLTGQAVWIGYVNADGAASQRVIAPVRVEGGFVTGYDHTADEVRTYPLHRITGVAELADG